MSLRKAVSDYRAEYLGTLRGTERFYRSLTGDDAITYGASGAGPHGKIDAHQRRIGIKRLRRSAKMLAKHAAEIQEAKSFGDIFVITESVRTQIRGLGQLWSYDAALRIAFNRGQALYPQAVFVLRNNTNGIRKIFTQKPGKGKTLPIDIFPKELQGFKPHELDHFLTVFGKL